MTVDPRRGHDLTQEELAAQEAAALPDRHALSVISDPTGVSPMPAEAMEQVEDVPAADPAPVGGRYTIQPVEEEPL